MPIGRLRFVAYLCVPADTSTERLYEVRWTETRS